MDAAESLTDLCKRLEAFETPRWAIEAILDVELTTGSVIDPCVGLGAIARVCASRNLFVEALDIEPWHERFPDIWHTSCLCWTTDFFAWDQDLSDDTVIMNPPFSKACEFVDHARKLNARKIICFQRHAWRESGGRKEWWEQNAPARVWVCGARADCYRFDLLTCQHPDGQQACPSRKLKGKKKPDGVACINCMGGSPTAHSWFVWERGHRGAELTSAIYPREAK